MRLHELATIVIHPGEALRAKARQIEVSCELAQPPMGSTIEEFPNLTLSEAIALLATQKETTLTGGVPLSAWSKKDQQRLIEGLKPIGHPEHPNV